MTAPPNCLANRGELMRMVAEVIHRHTNDPAQELITMGRALMEVGEALKGQSPAQARAILTAVQALEASR